MNYSSTKKASNFSNEFIFRLLHAFVTVKNNHNAEFVHGDKPQQWNYQDILFARFGSYFEPNQFAADLGVTILDFETDDPKPADTFDVVFAEIPMGIGASFEVLLEKSLKSLSEEGVLITIVHSFHKIKRLETRGVFNKLGIHPTSLMSLKPGFFPGTGITPAISCFKRLPHHTLTSFFEYQEENETDNLNIFVERHLGLPMTQMDYERHCKIEAKTADFLLSKIYEHRHTEEDNLFFGVVESISHFPGFEFWKFLSPFEDIDTDFQNYPKCYLRDVAENFNLTRDKFTPKANAVYVPLIGTQPVISDPSQSKIKHQNMCEVVLNQETYSSYLVAYLNSKFGRLFWEAAISAKPGVIKRLTKKDIENLIISLPPKEKQREIVEISMKIENAITALNSIKGTLATNPISSQTEKEKLDSILGSISEVSPLLQEESITHEFKASLRTPFPEFPPKTLNAQGQSEFKLGTKVFSSEKQIHKFLEEIVLKSIASFLNTRGGTLVIGVHERGNKKEVVGIDREGFESHDHFERHLVGIIKNNFGPVVLGDFISTKITEIDGKPVCVVTCEPKIDGEVFLNDELYIRTGPRVDKLSPKEIVEFVKSRQLKTQH